MRRTNIKTFIFLFGVMLFISCKKDNSPNAKSNLIEHPTEQDLILPFDADLMDSEKIIRRYKFNANGTQMELSKTWGIPSHAQSEITIPVINKVRDLVKDILIPIRYHNLKYVYFSVGKADGEGHAGVAQPIEAKINNRGYLVISVRGFVNESDGVSEFKHTLIHEFGHVFLEDISQMTPIDIANPTCSSIQNGGGDHCAKLNSYFNKYYQKFWKSIIIEWGKSPEKYYNSHKSDFVSGYASSNYGEDIAESFSFFIKEAKPTTTTTIANKKILFFYDYPELIKMRTAMRKGLN